MHRRFAAVLPLLLLAASPAVAGDVLVLKSGREVHGVVVEETPERLRLSVEGGSIWYSRDLVSEVRRGVASAAPEPPLETGQVRAVSREESSLLYADGERAGVRTLRVVVRPDEYEFDERVVFLGPDGRPAMEMRTLERSGRDFTPRFFQIQENSAGDRHRIVRGEVAGAVLTLTVTRSGETTSRTTEVSSGGRFPFAAREEFLRSSPGSSERSFRVFDTRDQRWRDVGYEDEGTKLVRRAGAGAPDDTVRARVVLRRRGGLVEREWVGPDLVAEMAELNGDSLRALRADPAVVAAVRSGDSDRVTGPDSAARALYADPVAGFRIEKPDPSWTFEQPAVPGAAALISVRNAPLMASVDVLRDETAPEGVTVERAGESLERLLRAHAPDLRVLASGVAETPAGRHYWLEASATRNGEKTVTIARVLVRDGRVYRLLAACVEDGAKLCRPDLDRILDSFTILGR